jgi:hypothetical protein
LKNQHHHKTGDNQKAVNIIPLVSKEYFRPNSNDSNRDFKKKDVDKDPVN